VVRAFLDEVESHARRFFSGHECTVTAWDLGPTPQMFPDARVLLFGPGPRTNHHVYVSVGASLVRSDRHREFVLCTRDVQSCHIETLAMITYYHHTEGLDIGHTLPVGRPWRPGASCNCFLVSLPYPFGPDLENVKIDGHDVQFLWLMPIFESESRLRHEKGLEALESLFDANGVEYLDESREPVA